MHIARHAENGHCDESMYQYIRAILQHMTLCSCETWLEVFGRTQIFYLFFHRLLLLTRHNSGWRIAPASCSRSPWFTLSWIRYSSLRKKVHRWCLGNRLRVVMGCRSWHLTTNHAGTQISVFAGGRHWGRELAPASGHDALASCGHAHIRRSGRYAGHLRLEINVKLVLFKPLAQESRCCSGGAHGTHGLSWAGPSVRERYSASRHLWVRAPATVQGAGRVWEHGCRLQHERWRYSVQVQLGDHGWRERSSRS